MIIILFLLTILSSLALAQDIEGAFGIKFGQKLSELKVIRSIDEQSNLVDPPVKVKGLTIYLVNVTPITGHVYLIIGMSDYIEEQECNTLLKTIKYKIEQKYDIKMGKQLDVETVYRGIKGTKAVDIRCSPTFTDEGVKYRLALIYADIDLTKQAEQEEIKLKSKEIDESGL